MIACWISFPYTEILIIDPTHYTMRLVRPCWLYALLHPDMRLIALDDSSRTLVSLAILDEKHEFRTERMG